MKTQAGSSVNNYFIQTYMQPSISYTKCCVLHYVTANYECDCILGTEQVTVVNYGKDLGIHIDSQSKFDSHITNIVAMHLPVLT